MRGSTTKLFRRIGLGIALAAIVAPVFAQEGADAPNLAEPVLRLIESPYLTDDERADLRVFHGVWQESDLESPKRRARAALMVGAWDDPVFDDEGADAEDRAEARYRRGDVGDALGQLEGVHSLRGQRLRAEIFETLGRLNEAEAAILPIVDALSQAGATDAGDLVEAVRALSIRARLRGQPASDYHSMMQLLGRARNDVDRLYWPVALAEAKLLYAKDNRKEAIEAAGEALRLNPSCADAWMLRARILVDGFNFDKALAIAGHADRIHDRLTRDQGGEKGLAMSRLVEARAWLRQNDPDLAGEEIEKVLARFPRMREALAQRAAVEAVRYDFERTEMLIKAFDALSPGSPLALYEVGRALSENRQYAPAASYLERASVRRENWPPPLVELGLLELQSGRDDRALRALRKVAELDPFNRRAANSLILIEELLTYDTVTSEHFVVRFKPGIDRVMAEEMLPLLEEMHRVVSTEMDHEPRVRTVIELMPNHEWFAVRITGMPALHTIAAATGSVIAMEAPKIGPKHTGEYDWVRVVRHEYTHTVTLSRTRNRIPHWFTEAAAVHMELSPRDYSTCQLLAHAIETGTLFDLRKINIAFVRPEKPTDRSQAYAQGHWMYEYMIEHFGARAPLKLMDLYAEGLREDEAMRSVLGMSQDEFFEIFSAWAIEQAKGWGMLASPTVQEMRVDSTFEDPVLGPRMASWIMGTLRLLVTGGSVGDFAAYADGPELVSATEKFVDGWLEETPSHPDLLALKIRHMLRATGGEPGLEDVALLEQYAAVRTVDPKPHRLLARLHLGSDEPVLAVAHLEYLDAREQKSPAYAVELARLYRRAHEFDHAAVSAERATQIAPFDAEARELAAAVALQQRDFGRAERHIRALTALEPDRAIHVKRLDAIIRMRKEQAGRD